MKTVVIESLIASQKVAVIKSNKLENIFIEDKKNSKEVSNIYRGIVKKVLIGIEACFVDIGNEKLAYLQIKKDMDIKSGQEILVQVNKEAIGSKGAKLNTEISLAGRYIVYIPSNDRITLSNKITEEKERFRLKKIAKSISKESDGIIVRTEAKGVDKEDLEKDLKELKLKYSKIEKEFKLGMGPKLLYKELDFASKYVKDNVNDLISKIVVNDEEKYYELKDILKSINNDYTKKLVLEKNRDVFDLYSVQGQIEKCLHKKVWLKSGGYLVIEKTEALTVIDVNTGKYTRGTKLEDAVYKTNQEASIEVARQLRLRDIAGIIIIDFIDMNKRIYKENIINLLNEEMSKDKRKFEVLGMTKLGLVEVARRRERESIDKYYLDECSVCKNENGVKSVHYVLDKIEKEAMRIKEHTSYKNIKLKLNMLYIYEIKEKYMDIIKKIEQKYEINLTFEENNSLIFDEINIIYDSLLTK